MSVITSRQNPRVKALVRLWERREREVTGRFLIEGQRESERALLAGITLHEVCFCPSRWRDAVAARDLLAKAESAGATLTEFAPEVFEKISSREGPDGILAVAERPALALHELSLPAEPLILVVERVEKPGNLGALLRTADAAGVDAVICAEPRTDFFNPHVIRNSQGAVFSVPCASATTEDLLVFLCENKVRIAATMPEAKTLYWDADLRSGLALCVGSESEGLTSAWLEAADQRLYIPMHGGADSLNVSVSAALCLYEAVRQRRA